MNTYALIRISLLALAVSLMGFATGCSDDDDDGGGSGNIGDNRAGVVVAMGDSITQGRCNPAGAPYPSRFSASRGVTSINEGRCAETAVGGAGRIGSVLSEHKPATLLVLYGANDIIQGVSQEDTINALRAIIQQAKANQTRVLIGTVLPMYDSHGQFQPGVGALNPKIRMLANQEKVGLVNLDRQFGMDRSLIQEDGLHPTDMGTQIIAFAFADRL